MSKVYRIEHGVTHDGPHHGSSKPWLESDYNEYMTDCRRHPSPRDDGIDVQVGKDYFGFRSLDDLRRWFYKQAWLQRLLDLGFVLTVYEAPEFTVKCGVCQVGFDRGRSTLVETRDLNEIFT